MVSRVAALVVLAFVGMITACGSGSPSASPSATQTTGFEKDEVKPTVSGRTTAPGTETPRPPPPPQLLAFDFIDTESGWLAFGNSVSTTIMGTSDGGHSWTELYQTPSEVQSLDFTSGSQGWMHSTEGLFATSDGGRTWQMVNSSDLPENARVQFVDEAHGWAAAIIHLGSQVFASDDGGHSWTLLATPCKYTWAIAVSFLDAATGWLACGGQPAGWDQDKELYKTSDAGQNWELVSSSSQARSASPPLLTALWAGYLDSLIFVDEMHGWMGTNKGGLLVTNDGGISWEGLRTGVDCDSENLGHVRLLAVEVGYGIAYKCGGVTNLLGTTDGGVTWSSLYPSPFLESCSTPELRSKPTRDLCGDSP